MAGATRRVRSCSRRIWWREPGRPGLSRKALSRMSRIVACRNHGALISGCVLCVTRHGPESVARSGTFCGMRVAASTSRVGVAPQAARRPACSTPHGERRTVCRTGTPSRWNMPEALVEVTVRQPCCRARDSRSVTPALGSASAVVLAMQKMATIVAPAAVPLARLARHEVMCPPVRMV